MSISNNGFDILIQYTHCIYLILSPFFSARTKEYRFDFCYDKSTKHTVPFHLRNQPCKLDQENPLLEENLDRSYQQQLGEKQQYKALQLWGPSSFSLNHFYHKPSQGSFSQVVAVSQLLWRNLEESAPGFPCQKLQSQNIDNN